MGSLKIRITSNKQVDQIKKKTATETFLGGILCNIKSLNTNPFLASMLLKKNGNAVSMATKTIMPIQNLSRKDLIFQTILYVK